MAKENEIIDTERINLSYDGKMTIHVFEDETLIIGFSKPSISINIHGTSEDLKRLAIQINQLSKRAQVREKKVTKLHALELV